MTIEEITEGNRLISEFLGYKYYPNENIQTYTSFRGEKDGDYKTVNIFSKFDKLDYCDNDAPSHWKLPKVVKTPFIEEDCLQYHKSWDWLIPVCGKIANICEEPEELDALRVALLCDDIITSFIEVVDWIKRYNEINFRADGHTIAENKS
jgi:hypothetical protein